MKIYFKELLELTLDFYKMRYKERSEKVFYIGIPLLIGFLFLVSDFLIEAYRECDLFVFLGDFLNQLVTVLALFISFTIAYLSILVTSSSINIEEIKRKTSEKYSIDGGKTKCTLYQVLLVDITYTLIVELAFLLFVFFQKFLIYLMGDNPLKFLLAINIITLVHVLLLTGLTIKNIYYSFWQSK